MPPPSSSPDPLKKAPSSTMPMLEIDGSTLEGGGQLVRNSLALAALRRVPLQITNIRGNRPKGGLKSSHSAAVNFMAKVCGATVNGAETGSKDLTFEPRADSYAPQNQSKTFSIDLNSPGSIFLIFQAVYPYLLFSSTASPKPVTLTITGGTNVTFSPSYEYVSQVLLPMLSKIGLPPLSATLQRRGWTTGKTQIGSITFTIHPLEPGACISAFSLTDRGPITRVLISLLAYGDATRGLLRDDAVEGVTAAFDGAEIEIVVDEDSGSDKRLYMLLVAESENGVRLGRDWLFDQKISDPKRAVKKLVKKVVKDLVEEVESGACVDEHMRDQVVLFQALAEGRSRVDGGCVDDIAREPTLHTRTSEWVARQVLGKHVRFDDESCEGIGLRAGEMFESATEEDELASDLIRVDLRRPPASD
jgi:RNA 3'-terminal phosphate cyclase (ATP)